MLILKDAEPGSSSVLPVEFLWAIKALWKIVLCISFTEAVIGFLR